MNELSVQEFKSLQESGEPIQLIDVREPFEREICHIGGELIPMNEVAKNIEKINKTGKVVIYCRSGRRSADIIRWLEKNHGFDNLYNLKGGVLDWALEIDPNMTTY